MEKIAYVMKKDFNYDKYYTKCPYGNNCMVGHENCWGCNFHSFLSLFYIRKKIILCKAGKHKEYKEFKLPPKPDPPPAPPMKIKVGEQ